MRVSGEGRLKSSGTGCTDGHIAQDHAENSFRFLSILHILREIIFITILSLYENGEINQSERERWRFCRKLKDAFALITGQMSFHADSFE